MFKSLRTTTTTIRTSGRLLSNRINISSLKNFKKFQTSTGKTISRTYTTPIKNGIIGISFMGIIIGGINSGYGEKIQLDDSTSVNEFEVSVDSSIDPFPTKLAKRDHDNLSDDYKLLGSGVRSVTFLGFKVYGIGIYISEGQNEKIKNLWNEKYLSMFETENHNLSELLNNSEFSVDLINRLIDNEIKFVIRISPVRNTDFGHLKDGLIKSILTNKIAKEYRDLVGEGLEELKSVFQGYKGSVAKNHLLWLEFENFKKIKTLNISYENTSTHEIKKMGCVNNPLIGRILMLQYLSGKKPLSEPLRKSCVDGFIGL